VLLCDPRDSTALSRRGSHPVKSIESFRVR
jgi:hypothetical protein